LLAFVDITVFVSCPKTKDTEELKTYFKVAREFCSEDKIVFSVGSRVLWFVIVGSPGGGGGYSFY